MPGVARWPGTLTGLAITGRGGDDGMSWGSCAVPHSKVADLARYGAQAKATLLRRHPVARWLAALLATVVWLEGQATDDALELLDLLMATRLHDRRAGRG